MLFEGIQDGLNQLQKVTFWSSLKHISPLRLLTEISICVKEVFWICTYAAFSIYCGTSYITTHAFDTFVWNLFDPPPSRLCRIMVQTVLIFFNFGHLPENVPCHVGKFVIIVTRLWGTFSFWQFPRVWHKKCDRNRLHVIINDSKSPQHSFVLKDQIRQQCKQFFMNKKRNYTKN